MELSPLDADSWVILSVFGQSVWASIPGFTAGVTGGRFRRPSDQESNRRTIIQGTAPIEAHDE